MGLIRLQNVCKQFGGQVVLKDVTLELNTGQTIGLVGPNGSGKTTLFRLMAGMLAPDTGTATRSKGLEIGYLPQEPQIGEGQTLHDEVLSVFAEVLALEQKLHAISEQMSGQSSRGELDRLMAEYDRVNTLFEAAGGYSFEQRLGEILGGLGFQKTDYELPMAALSGGQKCRAALAKLLLRESRFLLLDEPTNHLDIDAVRWLEKFLVGHHGGAMIVSHDRYLLDRLADHILEIENCQVLSYPGNYTNYVQTRDVRRLTQRRQFTQDQEFLAKERAFITKHMGKQRTKEAKGRRKRLERRLKAGEFTLEKPAERQRAGIRFEKGPVDLRAGRDVLEVQGLCKGYDEKVLFTDLSLTVPVGQRLGITGPNGTGKTTLLKIVLGEVPADAGRYHFDAKVGIGYYAQEATELNPAHTIVQEILAVRPDMLESQARSYAARFLFTGEDPFKLVGTLSGGEQSRVRLLKIILSTPNVLVLDEPTNHLDIPAREVLEKALRDFVGTIIAVSHDRYFLDRICDRLLVMRLNQHTFHEGNYTYYINQVEQQRIDAASPNSTPGKKKSKPAARAAEQPTTASRPRTRFIKLKLNELEELIMERETKLMELHERFGEPEVYQNPALLAELRAEFEELEAELAEAEQEWSMRAARE
ncbi:MAG: ABC-F family ATP-binding cassette domain-containing protein [Planctomycetota bacterium]